MKFKRQLQETVDADWQGSTLNLFSYDSIETLDKAVLGFLNSESFEVDCKRNFIKMKTQVEQNLFLGPAFNVGQLKIEDFRILDYEQVCQFFEQYAQEDWGNNIDGKDFLKVWSQLKNRLKGLAQDSVFYLISLEWFKDKKGNPFVEEDLRLRDVAYWSYTYYFLIVALDVKEKKLLEVEMFYE